MRDAAERRKNIAEDCAAAASSAVKVARQVSRETKAAAATAVKAAQQDVRDVKNESKMLAIQLVKTEKLGCKFRRNSGRNSQIPFRFGDFASGTTEYLYESSGFLRCLFIMSLS